MKSLRKNPPTLFGKYRFLFLLVIIVGLGFYLRYRFINSGQIIFDYDQIEDIFYTRKILIGDPPIIGRAIYGNPNLHHGVLYFYLNFLPFIIFKWNPIFIALWGSLFNLIVAIVVYSLMRSLFKKETTSLVAALLISASYEVIVFSGFISSISLTILTSPVFFLGLWRIHKNKRWGLQIALISIALSLQFDLMFLYLIPILFVFFLLFRPKRPSFKTTIYSTGFFLLGTSTLIATEFKLKFAGIKSLLMFSQAFDDSKIPPFERISLFVKDVWLTFSLNFYPQNYKAGILIGVICLFLAALKIMDRGISKDKKTSILFILFFLFSPLIMLLFGYHRQPWFFIGAIPAFSMLLAYILSEIRFNLLVILILALLVGNNISKIFENRNIHQNFFKIEESSILSSQLNIVDYTYREAGGKRFSINSISYPLYYSAIWEYHYTWYGGQKYGYIPNWEGGDQLPLYSLLAEREQPARLSFMIIDNTNRIPGVYKELGKKWALAAGKIVREENISGFTIYEVKK